MVSSTSTDYTGRSIILEETQTFPQATTFTNVTGEYARYYFKNNPWKLAINDYQKIFRYCIICGKDRFSTKVWSEIEKHIKFEVSSICREESCREALDVLPGFVPAKHNTIITKADKDKAEIARCQKSREFFDEIETVTTYFRNDQVFSSEKPIPEEYFETFEALEKIPVESRLCKIHKLSSDYKVANNIQCLTDIPDPFLSILDSYRRECTDVLLRIRASEIEILS